MSNADGKQPDPNELNLPGEDEQFGGLEDLDLPGTDGPDPLGDFGDLNLPDAGDPLDDQGQTGANELEPLVDEGLEQVAAESQVEQSKPEKAQRDERRKREPREGVGMAGLAVFGVCGLSILLLLVLDAMVFLSWGFLFMLLMNVFWLMATTIPFIMWMGRKTLNFYEVVLGLSLAGIIIAVALLLVEMVDYEGEVKPKGVASAVHLGADRTMTVA